MESEVFYIGYTVLPGVRAHFWILFLPRMQGTFYEDSIVRACRPLDKLVGHAIVLR